MTLEANKALARQAVGLWSSGDVDMVDRLFTADYVNHQNQPSGPAADVHGREAWKSYVGSFRKAFPDFRDTIEMQVAEGDLVATRFSSIGTHRGPFLGLAPTDRQASWSGISIDRIADGMIAETWVNWDKFGLLQQLGAAR